MQEPAYKVAASCAAIYAAAVKFKADAGIAVHTWHAANSEACAKGLAHVTADFNPVAILVNDAGIARDGVFHKKPIEQWKAVINTTLKSLFNMCRPVIENRRERSFGRSICMSSINGQKARRDIRITQLQTPGSLVFKGFGAGRRAQGNCRHAISPGYIGAELVMASPKEVLDKRAIPLTSLGAAESRMKSCVASCFLPPTIPVSLLVQHAPPMASNI